MVWDNPSLTQSFIRSSQVISYESSAGQIKQFHNDAMFKCYVFAYPILYLSFLLFTLFEMDPVII